jgi:hypothetical protein
MSRQCLGNQSHHWLADLGYDPVMNLDYNNFIVHSSGMSSLELHSRHTSLLDQTFQNDLQALCRPRSSPNAVAMQVQREPKTSCVSYLLKHALLFNTRAGNMGHNHEYVGPKDES